MIYKQRSHKWNGLKVLVIIPLILILLFLYQNPVKALDLSAEKHAEVTFQRPLKSGRLTLKYGPAIHPFKKVEMMHSGLDIACRLGTDIMATASGSVIVSDSAKAYGNRIILKHTRGYTSHYYHLHQRIVKKGQKVESGEIIGLVGSSGLSTAPHLHFEIRKNKYSCLFRNRAVSQHDLFPVFIRLFQRSMVW